jgi:hypothetical protein
MNDIVSFSVNGESYDIPKSEVDGFLSEFPDAVEVQTFISDKDTFDIPLDEVDGFKSEFPDAKEMLSVKKKGQTEPTQGTSTPVVSDVSEEPTPSPSVGQEQVKETTSGVGLDLSKITPQLIDLEEEEAISVLNKNYSSIGFEFEETGAGDAILVRKNGKEEVFDFDPFTESTEVSEAARMKQWMTENSTQEDVRKQLRSRHSVVKQYEDPQELELNPEEEFTTEKAETLGFNIPTTDSYMGQVINLTDVEKNKALNSKIKDEKDKEAMKMAVGMEQGKVINQITGEGDAITPGQDMVMSQQVYDKIEAKKAKSSKSHWEGGENYYVNVMLNNLDVTNPNKANDLRSRIENDDDFFNKEKSDLSSESAEVVRKGLDIVLSVNQDNYVSASEKAFDTVNKIAGLEPQLEKHLERIDGKSYNGTPEQFQEYSELITQVNQLSDSQEMRELRRSIDSLDSTYRDYETNPDVNILDAYETIKGNYQRQVDASYYKNNFVSDIITPITDGVMRSGLGLVSNVVSLVNNINTDNKWGATDDIAAWAKGASETYDLRNPAPSKFSRDFYEEVAIVGDYEVEIKEGNPTGRVFGGNGYLAQTDITENILKQYNDDPDLYDKEKNYNIRSGLYSSTEVGIDMVMGLMPVAGVFGKGFQAIGASETLAATLGMSAAVVVQSQDGFVQMAKDAGANDQEALAFGMAQSAAIAGIAAINPIEAKALMRITGSTQKSLAKKYVQNIVGGMSRKDAAAEVTKSLFSRTISKIGTSGKAVLKEGGKEGLEEILEIPAGEIISNGWQTVGGVNTYTEADIAEYINTFFLAGAGSLPFAFLGLSGNAKTNSKKELTYSATQNIDSVRKLFEENIGKKIKDVSGKEVELTQEYIDEHIGQLEELGKISEVYFSNKNLNEADKVAITDLLSKKKSFESKTTDDVSKNTFQSTIDDINASLNEYLNKGSKTPFYVINGIAMNKQQVEERLSNEDWVAGLKNGRVDVRIKNDKEMQGRFNNVVKGEKQKGRLTKFSTAQDGIVGEVTYEDGTKKELTQEEYDALEKQEGLFDVVAPAYKDERLSKLDELEEREKNLAKEAGYGLSVAEKFKRIFTDPLERKEGKALDELSDVEDEIYNLKYDILFDVGKGIATEEELKSVNDLRRDEELTSEQLDELLDKENKTKSDKKKIDELNAEWTALYDQRLDIEGKIINRYREQQTIQDDVETGTQPVAETVPTETKEDEPIELKEGEIDITTVFKNPVEKNNEQAVAASNEFKDKAGEYDEGVNDPKFKEENTTVEEISVDDIVPTQERLFEENLKSPSKGEPLVMKIGDKYYVEDGHHRIGNGINADNQTVSVRVYESDKAKQDAIQEQAAGEVPVQPEAKASEKVEEGTPKAEPEKPTQEGKEEVSEEEKVKAAKDNLNSVWEKWKQSQKNLGVVFDPKSKANEDMELLEAFVSYIQAIGAKTAKDIQKAFNDFTGGEATLDDAGADFVSESVKEPVTKKTDKELSREVTFTNIYDIIEKVEKRTPKKANPKEVNKRAYQNAYEYLLTSDWFASATDTEQTEAIDDLKKLTKQRRESSPSAKKILGIDSTKEKISVDQKTVRSWMMQDLAKGYKLGKRDAKKVMSAMARFKNSLENELVGAMREIQSSGKLSKKQVDAIVNKFQKTNVFNPDAVESFLNYMQKVVDNADHVDAVSKANSTRKQIKRRMKNKDVDNNLVQAAKEFAKINPSKVDDIDAYNQLAEKIKEGLSFSMNSKQGVKFRSAFDISTVEKYSELELKRQKLASEAAFEEMFNDMFGSDFGMTVSEMRDFYSELDKETEKDEVKNKETRAKKAMDSAVKAFDTYSAIINEMIESGVDQFTGDKLDVDSKTKELIKEFMDIDITKLSVKDAIRAVDALNNFVVNQTTGGLEAIVSKKRGENNVKKLVKDGVKSFKLKLPFGSGKTNISKFVEGYLNSFASLPNLLDNMFGGVRKALKVENAIGFSDVVNGRAAANTKASQVLEKFLDKFSGKEANSEDFNTAANMTERGLLGFMRRTVLSTDEKLRKAEFERRKNLIKESIDNMMKFGSEEDSAKAKIYMEAYNRLLEDSNSIEDVESKVDPVNKEAVEWWSDKFNEILPELTETSINVYNTVLENESNYNPDVFKKLNQQESELTELDEDSYNSGNGNEKVYDKKNPMLMRVKKPSSLTNKDSKHAAKGRYVSLDFDVNNFNSYESALVDINTASAIQQLKGALESDAFMQLVPDYSDRKILKDRITKYVAQTRGKGGVNGGRVWNDINKISNILARVGTATSLGGVFQPIKQTLPVFVNTLVNSGMSPEVFKSLVYVFDKDISNAINNSGMPIANRGAMSETTIDDIGKLSDKLSESTTEQSYNQIKELQDMWMKNFLQKPDAFIARASFLVYYKQELKRKGIDPSKIDWKNHKWNKEAANFAQRMVDRQQNVSDTDLQGLFLTERGGAAPIIRKILLPFQNFVLNQKNRMYSDIKALQYGSKEDKLIAIKSLLGLSSEWASFTIISIGIQEGMYMTAEALISQFKGDDEDDDEAKKKRVKEKERRRKMYTRSIATSAAKDFLSPAPFIDQPIIYLLNKSLEETGASIDKGSFELGVDFKKSMYEDYKKDIKDIDDEELKLNKSIKYLSDIIESQKMIEGEMYDVHNQKINEFDKRIQSEEEYPKNIREDIERYMKNIEVEPKPFQLYGLGKTNSKMTDMLGSLGIALDRMDKTQEMFRQAASLEYETESFGNKTIKKIPKELQQVMYIAAIGQLFSAISVLPSEVASTSNKIQKLVHNEAKTESQLELKRKNEIKKLIVETDPDYKGVESRVYSSLNTYAVGEYNKTLIEMNDEEIKEVFEYFDLR